MGGVLNLSLLGVKIMAVITPNTDLYLLKVPLEIDEINQLDFTDSTAQYNYFNSLPKITVNDFTYQRKDNTIKFPAVFDEVITYNYCMYRNTEYSDKWFYAFITNMEYVNDNVTRITIKTDPFQTWQFDLTYKPCLIDREHTNDDTVGKNTLPEGLELGEMVTNGGLINFSSGGSGSTYVVIVEVSQIENEGDGGTLSYEWEDGQGVDYNKTPRINGLIKGTTPLLVEYNSVDAPDFEQIRKIYELAGLSDSIVNVYPLPREVVTYDGANIDAHNLTLKYTNTFGVELYSVGGIKILTSSISPTYESTHSFYKPSSLGSYLPKNRKLLTYPYCYFNISNNGGSAFTYHYEDFSSENVVFKSSGVVCVGGSMKAIPQNYKRIGTSENALDFSVTACKYPTASWKSDSYTNWLTQNAVNMETQWKSTLVSAGVDFIGGGMVGSTVGGVIGGLIAGGVAASKEIISTAREQHLAKTKANFIPDQVQGNTNAGDFVWSKYRSPFTYIPMCIKPEYAQCIDEFFSQFGYKCNRVKIPNVKGRRNWNYVKTVGCYIQADIPQDDLAEIKNMFNNGITIWHDPAQFGNYGADNDII